MRRAIKWIGITAGVLLFSVVGLIVMARILTRHPMGSVLEVAIEGDIQEQRPSGALDHLFASKKPTVLDYVEAILKARDDERINGLLVTVDHSSLGFGTAQEMRDAIGAFRESGKWTVAYLETAGEFSSGNKDYYLATACESIWLAPPGDINLTGVRSEVPFVRGTLDKLGIEPDFDHIGEYKTAKNLLTDRAMTPAHRESVEAIVESIYRQLRRGIAEGRHMTEDEAAALIDRGPFTGPRALQSALVDRLGYRDELEAYLKERNGGKLPLIKVREYLEKGRYYDGGVKVALIYGVGSVTRGDSHHNPFTDELTMGSDTVTAAIREAREDPSIKAIVLRVDSPGGSYVSSDIILRELKVTRKVKPVVVSMGDVAASGGYFVSLGADSVIAEPGTVTASIGVVGGKFVTTGFWDKIGLTYDAVQRGRHATFYSSRSRYSPEERILFHEWLERIYDDFVVKVAEARGKTVEEVDAVARGRVWMGDDAHELGLIDELGGLRVAIRRAMELAEAGPEERARLVILPRRKGWLQELFGLGEETRAAAGWLRAGVGRLASEGPAAGRWGVLEVPFVPVFE